MSGKQVKIERFQQIVAAISAAHADQGRDLWIPEKIFKLLAASCHAAGKIQVAFKDGWGVNRLITHLSQAIASILKGLSTEAAGGRKNSYLVPALERRRLKDSAVRQRTLRGIQAAPDHAGKPDYLPSAPPACLRLPAPLPAIARDHRKLTPPRRRTIPFRKTVSLPLRVRKTAP